MIEHKLEESLAEAEEQVKPLDSEYKAAKQYMVDFNSEMDGHEKLQYDKLLSQTDRTGVLTVKARDKVARLMDSPYFGRIEGELVRKRQFKISGGTMDYAIESGTNVQDEILQKELSHTSDEKMKSIISTLSPNKVFGDYISDVIPSLGRNP